MAEQAQRGAFHVLQFEAGLTLAGLVPAVDPAGGVQGEEGEIIHRRIDRGEPGFGLLEAALLCHYLRYVSEHHHRAVLGDAQHGAGQDIGLVLLARGQEDAVVLADIAALMRERGRHAP